MKSLIRVICMLIVTVQVVAQAPLVKQWDKRFGGTKDDRMTSLQQTIDGGYLLGGFSMSEISGDKTESNWGPYGTADIWIVKIDSLGNKQWDKRYGGTDYEWLNSFQPTQDGGYILGGSSNSDISGDITQASLGPIPLTVDFWIVKIDSLRNIQWDKRFGGAKDDWLFALYLTTDGGYILGGFSKSGVSGDKTQTNRDSTLATFDYWVVKINSLGNKQWDKRYGGTNDDRLYTFQPTSDGGYILGGYSLSEAGGDKTQASWGSGDYWVVKIDSLGSKQWDKRYGGTGGEELHSLKQTTDGGYILGGHSRSGISGDKTQPNWDATLATNDYWIIKIDSLGNKQWDKRIGGTNEEEDLGNISQTPDSGYFIVGESWSLASGDKSEYNLGRVQTWIIKTDKFGNKQWDKTIFTPGHDSGSYGIETNDGCYVMQNHFWEGIGGYRTQPNWDTTNFEADCWIIKFCDTTFVSCTSLNVTTNSVTAHVTCYGASDGAAKAVASGGTPPYSFLWSDGQITDVPTGFPAGTHSVIVTDYNGCTATTSITIAEGELPCTGIQNNLLNNISLYPNPTSGTVILKGEIPSLGGMESLSIKLYDAIGRQLLNQTFDGNMLRSGIPLDLKDFPGSIFFLNVTTEAGRRVMKVAID